GGWWLPRASARWPPGPRPAARGARIRRESSSAHGNRLERRDRLFLVVVDGRQPDASVGMSLDELTWVFQRLGATHAVNLDGGGSSAMVVQGRVVNSPSDREG